MSQKKAREKNEGGLKRDLPHLSPPSCFYSLPWPLFYQLPRNLETTVLVSGLKCINISAFFPKMDLVHYLFYCNAVQKSVFSLNIKSVKLTVNVHRLAKE